jgi:hypothetical protein
VHLSTCIHLPHSLSGGSKRRGKDEVEDDEEIVRPSKLTARQQSSQRNFKASASRGKKLAHVSIKNVPYFEYKELRRDNPYLIPQNPRFTNLRFHNKTQEEIFYEIYVIFKKGVVPQHSINTAKMAMSSEYFGEAYAMCQEFGLYLSWHSTRTSTFS